MFSFTYAIDTKQALVKRSCLPGVGLLYSLLHQAMHVISQHCWETDR